MLPPAFTWKIALVGGVDYGDRSLEYAGVEVAKVTRRVDGNGYLSEVRRYAYPRPSARCSRQETGMRWVSRWAEANAGAIRRALREREERLGLRPSVAPDGAGRPSAADPFR